MYIALIHISFRFGRLLGLFRSFLRLPLYVGKHLCLCVSLLQRREFTLELLYLHFTFLASRNGLLATLVLLGNALLEHLDAPGFLFLFKPALLCASVAACERCCGCPHPGPSLLHLASQVRVACSKLCFIAAVATITDAISDTGCIYTTGCAPLVLAVEECLLLARTSTTAWLVAPICAVTKAIVNCLCRKGRFISAEATEGSATISRLIGWGHAKHG
mmetsp:Transcript_31055/g.60956  ORF Transcript_31055/g.60956 Transcript_31055/m.60956 type:complete len:218 (+) Transcript_31055:1133-1786(+)